MLSQPGYVNPNRLPGQEVQEFYFQGKLIRRVHKRQIDASNKKTKICEVGGLK